MKPRLPRHLDHASRIVDTDPWPTHDRWSLPSDHDATVIAEHLATGLPLRAAAARAGYDPRQVQAWYAKGSALETDAVHRRFALACERAMADAMAMLLASVTEAALQGDVGSARWLLERSPYLPMTGETTVTIAQDQERPVPILTPETIAAAIVEARRMMFPNERPRALSADRKKSLAHEEGIVVSFRDGNDPPHPTGTTEGLDVDDDP